MKRDEGFLSSKRFKFDEIDFRLDVRKNGRSQRLKIGNLNHREHTILLSRDRVNKGTKRMSSLPLSHVVIS